jgi:hypothetical protein
MEKVEDRQVKNLESIKDKESLIIEEVQNVLKSIQQISLIIAEHFNPHQ